MVTHTEVNKVILRAAEILELGWCRNALARDQYGNCMPIDDTRTAQWCIHGAVTLAAQQSGHEYEIATEIQTLARYRIGKHLKSIYRIDAISVVNDCVIRSQDEAVRAVRSSAINE